MCVSIQGHNSFRKWLVAWSAPSHYLNLWWNIVNWNLRSKHTFPFREIHLKMQSAKYRRLCLDLQYIPRNMHTVFALLCFFVIIHWLIFPYPSGLLHWHCGNLTIAPVPAKQLWWIWINTSYWFIMNDCITTTKQSTTKLCAYFLGYTVSVPEVPALYTGISSRKRMFMWLYYHIYPRIWRDMDRNIKKWNKQVCQIYKVYFYTTWPLMIKMSKYKKIW